MKDNRGPGARLTHSPSTQPERQLPRFCLWWPLGERPCYAPRAFMLVRRSGETLTPTCADHLKGWRAQIVGEYEALTLKDWEERGCVPCGAALGG